jgi:prepilin-type N-terminal cleavage/methylation domain-containing protein
MNPSEMAAAQHKLIRRGFTLIELATVVVILAILTALALPSLASQNSLTLGAASRVVVADLLYAQSQAIATGQNQYVTFTVATGATGGSEGFYSLSSPQGTVLKNPVSREPYTQTFGAGQVTPLASVALADVSLGPAANTVLMFDSMGQPWSCPVDGSPVQLSTAATLTLQSGMTIVTLSIAPDTGNITVSLPAEQ